MGRKRDEFWQYVDTANGNECIFCRFGIPGASRIKFHLAGVKGGGIRVCNKVPSEVQSAAASAINDNSNKRVKQSRISNDSNENVINPNLSSDSSSSRGKIEGHLLPPKDLVGEQFQRNVEQIWEWLMKDDVSSVMGIWGMGGVGKTALLKHINNKLVNAKKNVIWVTVSQNCSIHHLQKIIAKSIGIHLSDEDDKAIIPGKLFDAFKSINACVIILDDVRSDIFLEDMGIPSNNNGIRAILTSRSLDVCTRIGCEKNIVKVMPLSGEEAWDLFSKNLGNHGTLTSEAVEIAKQMTWLCDNLPLAIVTIARSMRGKQDIREWKNALSKLDSPGMDHDDIKRFVFPELKSSFDNLNDSTLQDCFLFMALSDGLRTVKEMTTRLVDEELINGRQGLEAQLDECQSILNKLINNSLLSWFDGKRIECARLARAMALSIGKESHGYIVMDELLDEQKWKANFQIVILDCDIAEIPFDLSPRCPKLSTFIMTNNDELKVIPNNFFTNIPSIKVLDLSSNFRIEGLPVSISNLECLTVLLLRGCESLHRIPSLAKLRRLRRLDLSGTAITEVPQGFENFTNLRWLDLLETEVQLKAQDLERLKMLESIATAFDNEDEFNACVQIIQDRINSGAQMRGYLLLLQGHLTDWDHVINDYVDVDIDKDKVVIFDDTKDSNLLLPGDIDELKIKDCDQWGSCICDVLSIQQNYGELHISRCIVTMCDELYCIFCSSSYCTLCSSLRGLNALYLEYLGNLSMLCKENQVASPFCPFSFVRTLHIKNCNNIRALMTPGMSTQLHNLEEMRVKYCALMEEIFSSGKSSNREVDIDVDTIPRYHSLVASGRSINREFDIDVDMIPHCQSFEEIFSLQSNNEVEMDQTHAEVINLPNLKKVELEFLSQLTSVCKGTMHCGSLHHFSIVTCPKLKAFPKTNPSFKIDVQ